MTVCKPESLKFEACQGKKVEADFEGGDVTSDGGLLLLRRAEACIGLMSAASSLIPDPRDPCRVQHSQESMLTQRVFGIAQGYEDLNDHNSLRHDVSFQTAANRQESLASSPTLCRMENRASREVAWGMHKLMFDTFVRSFREAPTELILDFDATDDRVHGMQSGRHFSAYYDEYCFLPLYVFCGDKLLVSYLRPGNVDGAKHSLPILAILVREMRKVWPEVNIIFRADGGFCRKTLLSWCSKNDVGYVVGLPKNSRLLALSEHFALKAQYGFQETGEKSRTLGSFRYAAGTWKDVQRKVIARAEFGDQGIDMRFVVTNLQGGSKELYEGLYCERGEMENRIKETKLMLFSDRTSCQNWEANQFRVLLSSFAYVLLEYIRSEALSGTSLAQATMETIRVRLLKVGAVILRNTRRIVFKLATGFPLAQVFAHAARKMEGTS